MSSSLSMHVAQMPYCRGHTGSELAAKRQLATSPMSYLNCQALLCRLATKQVDEGGSAAPPPPSGSTPAGHDDGLGPILPDFGSLLHADKPDARRSVAGIMTAS